MTITLDDEVARWARVLAAQRDMSLSRLVAELLREKMQEVQGYKLAMGRYLRRRSTPLKRSGRYPPRAELHDRPGLR